MVTAWFSSILLACSSPALARVAHRQLVWSPLLCSSSIQAIGWVSLGLC